MTPARHNPAVFLLYCAAISSILLSVVLIPVDVQAQGCAMCQTVMPKGDDPLARGLFWSVLLLMSMPFLIGGSIGGWLFYKHWRMRQEQRAAAPVVSLHLAYTQKEGQP